MTAPHPLPFPLSKFMDLERDRHALAAPLAQVAAARATDGQHPARAWEYAMALHTLAAWTAHQTTLTVPLALADVGGAGSRFAVALETSLRALTHPVLIIDPNLPPEIPAAAGYKGTIEAFADTQPHPAFDALFALSVLEHVPTPRPFLRACRQLLKPDGLLFLTVDAWNSEGPDTAHFSWMRERIYNPDSITKVQQDLREMGFRSFGRSDWTYPGDQLYGSYTFASIAMVRTTP